MIRDFDNREKEFRIIFFGEMGLNRRSYVETTPFMFFEYMYEGYRRKNRKDRENIRNLGNLLIMPHVKENSPFDIRKMWYIEGDELEKNKTSEVLNNNNVDTMLANFEAKRKKDN